VLPGLLGEMMYGEITYLEIHRGDAEGTTRDRDFIGGGSRYRESGQTEVLKEDVWGRGCFG